MKIVDCFIFYNEIDLLTYRLHVLNEVVDYFVIVESIRTFMGNPKKIYYEPQAFQEFQHKIIHVIVDVPFPHANAKEVWENECAQRNAIAQGIVQIPLENSDILMITDVDEIPDPRTLLAIKQGIPITIHSLQMDMYYYHLRAQLKEKWTLSKILSYKKYNELQKTCNEIRKMECPLLMNGGWHLSYFGDASFISNKIKQFSHQEYNTPVFTNEARIDRSIHHGTDLYARPCFKMNNIKLEENTYLPVNYSLYLQKYC